MKKFSNTEAKLKNSVAYKKKRVAIFYKSFIKPHLDQGVILYDKKFNNSFHERMESIQYHGSRAIAGAIRDNSRKKVYFFTILIICMLNITTIVTRHVSN